MPPFTAPDFSQICPGLWVWHAYDPTVKTELFSTAIATSSGICLIDPIPLPDSDLAPLTTAAPIAGVLVTNGNHQRAALDYSDRFAVPVFGHTAALAEIQPPRRGELPAFDPDLEAVEIPGAAPGEIALYQRSNGGTLILGDALINLEPYGFAFLPAKYCLNPKQMRRSLGKLTSFSVERILFAHGTPIVARAGERLRELFNPS